MVCMSTIKKRHHTVPEMHLKHFAASSQTGQVWVYDKQDISTRPSLPSETGHQRYFYAVKDQKGEIDNRLEDYLANIESKADPIYVNMLRGSLPISAQERHDFSHFLALMYFRTPTMRRISAEMQAAALQNSCYAHTVYGFDSMIKGMEQRYDKTYSEEEKEKLHQTMIDPQGYVVQVPAERTLDILATADKLTLLFERMHWALVAPKHGFFVTCDNPVFRAVDPRTSHPIMGDGGFHNKSLHVTFPLSPKMALLMCWRKPVTTEIVFERPQVNLFNQARAYSAERFVYAHLEHKKIVDIVKCHKDSKIQFRASGFGPKNYSKVKVKPPARS